MPANVLLVVLDAARRDGLEPYGGRAGSTPTIAQLARRGSALKQAYATASWTLPSHVSMFTGLLPRQLGLGQPPGGNPQGARPALEGVSARMLGNVLHAAGYESHGLTTNVWASEVAGFDIGFDSFKYVCSGREERMHQLIGQNRLAQLAWARAGLRSSWDDGAAEVGTQLRRSIDRWSGQPTFWFVNLGECHSPYLPPRPWNDLPPLDRIRAALEAQRHLNFQSICLYAAGGYEIPDAALQRMRYLYARAIGYMDSWLADTLEALDARGILDETLVIVTSDHGENFGEGGLITHGFSVDQRLIHVPLVMAGPGALTTDEVFSLAQLPGIVARAAGVEDHPYASDSPPAGLAFAQFDPMSGPDHPKVVEFAAKWGLSEEGVERLCARFTTVTDGATKLVIQDDRELVYDLVADPGESTPLADPDGQSGIEALRAALEHPSLDDAVAEAPVLAAASAPSDADAADIERRMKLLGYM
jgi:arylsulfatase A-like enzyme